MTDFRQPTSQADISAALQYISPDISRDDWVQVGMALQHELGDTGFDLFDTWSSNGQTYQATDAKSAWRSFKPGGNGKSLTTIATVFGIAQDNGYRHQRSTQSHQPPSLPKPAETEAEATQKRQQSRDKANALWAKGKPAKEHPYTTGKGLEPDGLRVKGKLLLIPMYDANGKLTCILKIDPDPKPGEEAKKFEYGCQARDCYYPIGKPIDNTLVITEGWATGMSIHLATGLAVAVAFSSGNLPKVAALMREKYPDFDIVLAPDNDESQNATDKAEAAARDYGCQVVIPQFPEGTEGTDFDDLRQSVGLDEVKQQIEVNRYLPEASTKTKSPIHDCKLINMESVEMEPVEWLWPGRFPLGKLCLLGGKPGVGKTQIALSIAAIVTIGGKWFDSGTRAKRGKVLFLTSEDDLADTVKPRLVAAGADTSKVTVLQSVARVHKDQVIDGFFSLSQDIQQLDGVLKSNRGIRLVIFDPLQAYLGVRDSHRNADVREVLGPLSALASKHRVTVLGIEHLGKSAGRVDPMAAFLGSTGIIASARSTYMVCKDKADEQGDRLFLPVKVNLSPDEPGLTFRLVGKTLDNGIETSCVDWTGHTEQTARDALDETRIQRDSPAEDDAEDFLHHLLSHGPVKVADVRSQAKEAGHAWRTVERAKSNLGYKAKNRGQFYGNAWWWMTPEQLTEDEVDLRQKNADSGGDRQHIRAGGLLENEPENESQNSLKANTGNGLSHAVGSPPRTDGHIPDGGLPQEAENTRGNGSEYRTENGETELL